MSVSRASTPEPTSGGPDLRVEPRRLATAVLLLVVVTLGGTLGFSQIEGWSAWDSLYFTLMTITTVGYGDQGISESGRRFATVLMVGGVAGASYSFAMIVQASVASQFAWRNRMQKKIDRTLGHTIVCGYGRLGSALCDDLRSSGVSIVVVERDPRVFHVAVENGYLAIEGTATDDDVLLAAGVARASHLVSSVDSVADNVLVVMSAKELNPTLVVYGRAEHKGDGAKLSRVGADHVISPFQSGASELAVRITEPSVADFLARASISGGDVALADIEVETGSLLIDTSLGEYGRGAGTRLAFVALGREKEALLIPPGGAETVRAGDHLIVAGDPEQIAEMKRAARVAGRAPEAPP